MQASPPGQPNRATPQPGRTVHFASALDNAPVLIWMSGPRRGLVYVNRTWVEFTGRSVAEELGNGWLDNVHPDDVSALAACDEAFASRKPVQCEYRLRRKDGAWRWMRDNAEPRVSPGGDLLGYIGTCIDITDLKETETALRSSEERLQMAQEAASVGTYDWDIVADRITWSPEMFRLHGIDPAREDLYAAWIERLHPEDRDRAHRETLGFVESADRLIIEFRTLRPDGSIRWILGRGRMIRDESGRPLRMIGVNIDVTDQRLAEEAARDNEQRLQDIAENFPGVIFRRVTYPDGRIEYPYFSRPDDKLFGISRERISAVETMEDMAQLIHYEDYQDLIARFRQAAATLSPLEVEGRVLGDDGEICWVRSISRPRPRPDGALVWDGVILDVTDQHRREGERERAATMLRMGIEVAGVGTWEFDPRTHTVTGSAVTNALFGIEDEDPRALEDYLGAVHPDDRDPVMRGLLASATDKTTTAREYRVLAPDGSVRWVSSHGAYVRLADGTERVIGALFETTERKRREEERETALQHQKVLLRELNHRIKNNLQMVTSVLRLQAKRVADRVSAEQFQKAVERVEMISDLHAQLRVDGGLGQMEMGAYLQSFCGKISTSLLDETAIVLQCAAEPCVLDLDRAVPLALIVNELVTNSIKYAFPEGRRGTISVSLEHRPEGQLRLSVSDDGCGMPAFGAETTGLGMQLVEGLCRQIGAELEATVHSGCRHIITLPAVGSRAALGTTDISDTG